MSTNVFGLALEVETAEDSGSYTPITKCAEIAFPDLDKAEWDGTTYDSEEDMEEAEPGQKTSGVVRLKIKYDHANSLHRQLWSDWKDNTKRRYRAVVPNSHGQLGPFRGWVKRIGHPFERKGGFFREVDIRMTGNFDYV